MRMLRFAIQVADPQLGANRHVIFEHPTSKIWSRRQMKKLLAIQGVHDVVGDQCCLGGMYVKPTRWRSNAPWFSVLAQRCPGQPGHAPHQKLRGWTKYADGQTGWLTALGAEYPEGLCHTLARGYVNHTGSPAEINKVKINEDGTVDPLEPESKRVIREQENKDAIGGMRSPHKSLTKVPGWKQTGQTINEALDPIIDEYWDECVAMYDSLGDQQDGFSEQMVEQARRALEKSFSCKYRRSWPGWVRSDLVEAITAHAGDPDNVLHKWLAGETPLGIRNEIEHRGIFPEADAKNQEGHQWSKSWNCSRLLNTQETTNQWRKIPSM